VVFAPTGDEEYGIIPGQTIYPIPHFEAGRCKIITLLEDIDTATGVLSMLSDVLIFQTMWVSREVDLLGEIPSTVQF
jgi:hypothetical protein